MLLQAGKEIVRDICRRLGDAVHEFQRNSLSFRKMRTHREIIKVEELIFRDALFSADGRIDV
jgi:hypothetical protein